MKQNNPEQWASRIGLILAVAGNAVGLGNFLRFPAQAVTNGGGAFIIPYLVSFAVMGIPLLWVEWAIGRHGGQFGHHSTPGMLDSLGKSKIFKYFGIFGIFTNIAVAAYYVYIESWTLGYVWFSLTNAFGGETNLRDFFNGYLGKGDGIFNIPDTALIFFLITIALNLWILSRGISGGIEKAGKIMMPLLILFGIFLAIRALTITEGEMGAIHSAINGLNFLWEPQFDSLANPKVWLAAAGQVFFTLSVGMGSIHCYAAYLREHDDIALNSATAGMTNEFVEVILGGSIIIPIAYAYLAPADWVALTAGQIGGFEIGFVTIPSLFQNWGPFLSAVAGMLWFGLLFFAGITSSLAMGQPIMAFLQDSFGFNRKKSTTVFGIVLFLFALPSVFLYSKGAFNEFDFWAGTFGLVTFALIEVILFAWVFGIDNAWNEINKGADLKVPHFFKYVIKYVTPVFLLIVFLGAMFQPQGGNWGQAFSSLFSGGGWEFDAGSIIGALMNKGNTDPESVMVVNITRIFLLMLFAGIGVTIYLAWRDRENKAL